MYVGDFGEVRGGVGIAVVKCYYGINVVTHYFKKNEYQNGESCNPLAPELNAYSDLQRGAQWHSWLGHYITNQKVVGSIPNGVTGIFH
jgi:hypothetical protein